MSIMLTEKAAGEVKRVIESQQFNEPMFLRVGITAGGCSGFNYSLQFEKSYDELNDSRFEQFGVQVVVDKRSELYLDGTTVDYYESVERRGFTFSNPNAIKSCGCGH
ncbi:MAG: iron-sulfur cluster assembly accessory protein [Planctomycetes bacterium]|nr:iron-sulfur cluster assembly accessory protein [Planctomycetota bacterium]